MVDFAKAFEDGKEAAHRADLARKEIAAVFQDLNDQLAKATEGKIAIQIKEVEDIPDSPFIMTLPKTYHQAILAFNPKLKSVTIRELATWKRQRTGYPCLVSWSGQDKHCEDREALEICLADLVRDPINAEKLLALINSKEEPEKK